MDMGWIAAVSGFALVMAATPGPNNTLVTASGANYGFRRTVPLMSGITVGVAVIIFAVGAMGGVLFEFPFFHAALKWLGLAYLLWLAWKIASARPAARSADGAQTEHGKPLSFIQGALLQFINPKLWVMVAGAVVTYGSAVQAPLAVATAFAIIFGGITFASVMLWTLIGAGTGRLLRSDGQLRLFNGVMAGLLLASLIPEVI